MVIYGVSKVLQKGIVRGCKTFKMNGREECDVKWLFHSSRSVEGWYILFT